MPANVALQRLSDERDAERRAIDEITAAADEDDRDLTDTDQQVIKRHQDRVAELEPQIEMLAREAENRAKSTDARQYLQRAGAGAPPERTTAQPTGEVVHRSYGEYARDWLISNIPRIGALVGPVERDAAGERVRRSDESAQAIRERGVLLTRAVANTISTDIPGLIPPAHLAQIIDVINASRPVVEASRRVPLTSGKLNWPSITQRPTVAKKTGEKVEATSQKMTVAMTEVTAEVYAGTGDLSWEAVNWSTPNALALFMDLLGEAYARATETAACTVLAANAQATAGLDHDTATPQQWYTALAAAAGMVYTQSRRGANTVFSDVATAFAIAPAFAAASPIFLPGGQISLADGTGTIAGLRLVPSYGFAAKTVIVGDAGAFLCAETPGAPVELRAIEPALGGFEVGVIGAFKSAVTDIKAFAKVPDVP